METLSKNQPCYCGSGKKFNICCMIEVPPQYKIRKPLSSKEIAKQMLLDKFLYFKTNEESLPVIEDRIPSGFKTFLIYRLEQLISALNEDNKDNNLVLSIYGDLYWLFYSDRDNLQEKIAYIKRIHSNSRPYDVVEFITDSEIKLLLENTVEGGLMDYVILPEGAIIDYDALRRSCEFTKMVLSKGIEQGKYISSAKVYTDTGDTIVDWELQFSESPVEAIWITYKPMDVLENEYKILKNILYSFTDESIKTLATTISLEKNMYKKSSDFRSYTGLIMSYFGVIEREIKSIILNREDRTQDRKIMWRDITNYTVKNDFPILKKFLPDVSVHLLNLNPLRNKAAHGEFISEEEFNLVKRLCFKQRLLEYICWEKNGIIPSVQTTTINMEMLLDSEREDQIPLQFPKKQLSDDNKGNATLEDDLYLENTLSPEEAYQKGLELFKVGNYGVAISYFKKAANENHIHAIRKVGHMCALGQGINQDYKLALKWIRESANQKDSKSQLMLASMYSNGHGVKRNYEKAFKWYKKAATNKYPNIEAQYYLANCYLKGWGTPINGELAKYWYDKSGENGHIIAQFNLGILYRDGKEIKQDLDLAYKWLRIAADNGFKDAQGAIDELIEFDGYFVPKCLREKEPYFKYK